MLAPKSATKHAQNAAVQYKHVQIRKSPKNPKLTLSETQEKPTVATNRQFFGLISSGVVSMSPKKVAKVLELNINAGKSRKNLEIAAAIKKDPLSSRFRKPELYLLFLQLLAAEGERKHVLLCLQLFAEMSETTSSPEQLELAANHVFRCFENCSDFTQLLGLKIVFLNVFARVNPGINASVNYLAAHMHVLLNSGQFLLAMDHFHGCLAQVSGDIQSTTLLRALPLEKLVKTQCMAQDCDALVEILTESVSRACTNLIAPSTWTEILSTALWKNHYKLVKLVYVNVIMDGVDLLAMIDSVLETSPTQNNRFLHSLSQHTVSQILHTLATHGDVALCLNLIEWHYLHKSMRGERALTKDLCLQVITAYCHYHPKSGELAEHHDDDTSVKTVLDVIDTFVSKRNHCFDYRDLVDAFLHKLNTYSVFDANVAYSVAKEQSAPWKPTRFVSGMENPVEEMEDNTLLTKKSNKNVHQSAQGSVLKNTTVLLEFITDHLHHIASKMHNADTCQIFVNCVLAHLSTYQNTTGVVAALHLMKLVDADFVTKSLDQALYDIIIKSISESPAAMATGLTLYTHMKQKKMAVSLQNFKHFVFSSLRGDAYNLLLEYYVFEYLKLGPDIVSAHLVNRIQSFKNLNMDGKSLLRCLENYLPQDHHRLEEIWDAHHFTRLGPILQAPGDEYLVYYKIDQRDKRVLEQILS